MDRSKTDLGGWRQGMQKIWRGAAVVALALGLLLGTTAARQYDIKLVVTVTDCVSGQPIQGATVNVLSAATAQGSQYLATTNAKGRATITPTLEATLTPTASSTADDAQAARCGSYLAEPLKGLVATEDSTLITGGINGVAQCMLQCRGAAFNVAPQPAEGVVAPVVSPVPALVGINYGQFYACFQGCADFGYFQNAARAIITNAAPTGKIISTLASLLSGAEGAQACGDSGAFVFQLVKQLAIQGSQVNIVAVHSPVNFWVTDKEGRRAGFLEDGKTVEEVPGARAVISGESKYVLIPVIPGLKVDLKSSGQGTMTVELAYTKADAVQDVAFYDAQIEPETTGGVNLTPSQPVLNLDTPGVGTQAVPPSRFEETPVTPAPTKGGMIPATIESAISATPEPDATAAPKGLLNDQRLKIAGVAGGACCLGLLLAGVLLGVAIWLRRRARRTVVQPAPSRSRECPRCGATCQADARFCYKCGQSFVQTAAPQPAISPLPAAPPPPAAPVACTNCGQALRAMSKFCSKCGQPTGR